MTETDTVQPSANIQAGPYLSGLRISPCASALHIVTPRLSGKSGSQVHGEDPSSDVVQGGVDGTISR